MPSHLQDVSLGSQAEAISILRIQNNKDLFIIAYILNNQPKTVSLK